MNGVDYEKRVLKLREDTLNLTKEVLKSLSPSLLEKIKEFVKLREEITEEYSWGGKGLVTCLHYKYKFYRKNTIDITEEIAFLETLNLLLWKLGERNE